MGLGTPGVAVGFRSGARHIRHGLFLAGLCGLLWSGCDTSPAAELSSPVVYGSDDRREFFEAPPSQQALATQALVALVHRGTIARPQAGTVGLASSTLAEQQRRSGFPFCPSVPFQNQPGAAFCSGVLVDDDLVLTAAHCILSETHCRKVRFVFDYFFRAPGTLASLDEDSVYACSEIVTEQDVRENEGIVLGPDLALLRLDRPATGRTPAVVASRPPTRGEPLLAMGFPLGAPAKLDAGGIVLAEPDASAFFQASIDAFAGNSGSGVFRMEPLELLGILSFGEADFITDEENGCAAIRVIETPTSSPINAERVSVITPSVELACRDGLRSERLCSTPPTCGNGLCEGVERFASCPQDCAEPICGDGICQLDERPQESGEPGPCAIDCGDPVPTTWRCEPGLFDGSNGCDRFCGDVDPDCVASPAGSCSSTRAPSGNWVLFLFLFVLARRRGGRNVGQVCPFDLSSPHAWPLFRWLEVHRTTTGAAVLDLRRYLD